MPRPKNNKTDNYTTGEYGVYNSMNHARVLFGLISPYLDLADKDEAQICKEGFQKTFNPEGAGRLKRDLNGKAYNSKLSDADTEDIKNKSDHFYAYFDGQLKNPDNISIRMPGIIKLYKQVADTKSGNFTEAVGTSPILHKLINSNAGLFRFSNYNKKNIGELFHNLGDKTDLDGTVKKGPLTILNELYSGVADYHALEYERLRLEKTPHSKKAEKDYLEKLVNTFDNICDSYDELATLIDSDGKSEYDKYFSNILDQFVGKGHKDATSDRNLKSSVEYMKASKKAIENGWGIGEYQMAGMLAMLTCELNTIMENGERKFGGLKEEEISNQDKKDYQDYLIYKEYQKELNKLNDDILEKKNPTTEDKFKFAARIMNLCAEPSKNNQLGLSMSFKRCINYAQNATMVVANEKVAKAENKGPAENEQPKINLKDFVENIKNEAPGGKPDKDFLAKKCGEFIYAQLKEDLHEDKCPALFDKNHPQHDLMEKNMLEECKKYSSVFIKKLGKTKDIETSDIKAFLGKTDHENYYDDIVKKAGIGVKKDQINYIANAHKMCKGLIKKLEDEELWYGSGEYTKNIKDLKELSKLSQSIKEGLLKQQEEDRDLLIDKKDFDKFTELLTRVEKRMDTYIGNKDDSIRNKTRQNITDANELYNRAEILGENGKNRYHAVADSRKTVKEMVSEIKKMGSLSITDKEFEAYDKAYKVEPNAIDLQDAKLEDTQYKKVNPKAFKEVLDKKIQDTMDKFNKKLEKSFSDKKAYTDKIGDLGQKAVWLETLKTIHKENTKKNGLRSVQEGMRVYEALNDFFKPFKQNKHYSVYKKKCMKMPEANDSFFDNYFGELEKAANKKDKDGSIKKLEYKDFVKCKDKAVSGMFSDARTKKDGKFLKQIKEYSIWTGIAPKDIKKYDAPAKQNKILK
ncbi:MAG: hypothetical protein IJM14_07950 [Lachnospiraceae bacterium]|nr:hypothetical protein [Lachnospiraceae bacterium]